LPQKEQITVAVIVFGAVAIVSCPSGCFAVRSNLTRSGNS
jgi:hypothetical protein